MAKKKNKKGSGIFSKTKKDYAGKMAKKGGKLVGIAKKQAKQGLGGYTTKKMKSYDGKTYSYHVRTDSRGRQYILNTGNPPPRGYTSGSKGYYGLKKNLRITADSSKEQKRFGAAQRAVLWGADPEGRDMGAIDRMGMRGQNYNEKGTLYSNLRQDSATRKLMDKAKAFFTGDPYGHAGVKGRKRSKHTMAFGQDGREA